MQQKILTRAERIEIKRAELALLKAELKKANSPYKRSVIQGEIRSVARELARLTEP